MAFLCRRFRVPRSGFYVWLARDGSERRRSDEALGARIERIHAGSGGRYGSPRVHELLRREGMRCSNKRVARLMRERGLPGRVSRVYRRSPALHKFFAKTGNLPPRHCQDNAHMESFFHSLKAELTHQRSYASDAELNASVATYINRFYN